MGSPAPNPPRQKRSRRTLDRIVAAGRAVLRERGPEGLTVQEVVARARTSVGSFYQRFAGREELLRHLEQVVAGDAAARFAEALAARVPSDQPLAVRVDAVVALMHEEREGASDLLSIAELERARADAVVGALQEGTAIRHADPEVAIRVGYAAVSGALRAPPSGVPPAALLPELGRMWLAHLGGTAGTGADQEPVDFFDVWG